MQLKVKCFGKKFQLGTFHNYSSVSPLKKTPHRLIQIQHTRVKNILKFINTEIDQAGRERKNTRDFSWQHDSIEH